MNEKGMNEGTNSRLENLAASQASVKKLGTGNNGRGKPTASSLSADGFPLMAGPNFQPLDGNPTVISILRQLADGSENVLEM
jgi:hypothetical protein